MAAALSCVPPGEAPSARAPAPEESAPPASALAAASEAPVASAAPVDSAASAPDPREQDTRKTTLLEAWRALQEGGSRKVEGGACLQGFETVTRLLPQVPLPEGEAPVGLYRVAARCAERAGDCKLAWSMYRDGYPREVLGNLREEKQAEAILFSFGSLFPGCKSASQGGPGLARRVTGAGGFVGGWREESVVRSRGAMGTGATLLLAVVAVVALLIYWSGRPKKGASSGEERPAGGVVVAVARTDPGLKRKHNEDSFLVLEDLRVYAVADGMGRHAAGEVASRLAVDTIASALREAPSPPADPRALPPEARRVEAAVLAANREVLAQATQVDAYHGMGTTLVLLQVSSDLGQAVIASAGDSRCYRLRDGDLRQLTVDHTLGAAGLQGSNAAMLSRAVGLEESLEVDLLIEAPRVSDLYMLCSDGLSRMVSHDALVETLMNQELSLEDRAHRLVEQANQAGGRDNVTVILVQIAGGKRP